MRSAGRRTWVNYSAFTDFFTDVTEGAELRAAIVRKVRRREFTTEAAARNGRPSMENDEATRLLYLRMSPRVDPFGYIYV